MNWKKIIATSIFLNIIIALQANFAFSWTSNNIIDYCFLNSCSYESAANPYGCSSNTYAPSGFYRIGPYHYLDNFTYINEFYDGENYPKFRSYLIPDNLIDQIKEHCSCAYEEPSKCDRLGCANIDYNVINNPYYRDVISQSMFTHGAQVWNDYSRAIPNVFGGYYDYEAYINGDISMCSILSNIPSYIRPAFVFVPPDRDIFEGSDISENLNAVSMVSCGSFRYYQIYYGKSTFIGDIAVRSRDQSQLFWKNYPSNSSSHFMIHEVGHTYNMPDYYYLNYELRGHPSDQTHSVMDKIGFRLGRLDKLCAPLIDARDSLRSKVGYREVYYYGAFFKNGGIQGYADSSREGVNFKTEKGYYTGNPLVNLDDSNDFHHEYFHFETKGYPFKSQFMKRKDGYLIGPNHIDAVESSLYTDTSDNLVFDSPPILTAFYEYDMTEAYSLFNKEMDPEKAKILHKKRNTSYEYQFEKVHAENLSRPSGYYDVLECLDNTCDLNRPSESYITPSVAFDPITSTDIVITVNTKTYRNYINGPNFDPDPLHSPLENSKSDSQSGAIRIHPGLAFAPANNKIMLRKSYVVPTTNCIEENCGPPLTDACVYGECDSNQIITLTNPIFENVNDDEYVPIGVTNHRPSVICDARRDFNCTVFWLDVHDILGRIAYINFRVRVDGSTKTIEFEKKFNYVKERYSTYHPPVIGVFNSPDFAYFEGEYYLTYKSIENSIVWMKGDELWNMSHPEEIPDIFSVDQPEWQAPVFFNDHMELHWTSIYP